MTARPRRTSTTALDSVTVRPFPPVRPRPVVIADEGTDGSWYVAGHLNRRRALAAVLRHVREDEGTEGRAALFDGLTLDDVAVVYLWVRPAPTGDDDEATAWCGPEHPQADPVTAVGLP